MATETVSVTRRGPDLYSVTVQDTGQIIGKDENLNNIYKTYGVNYYPSRGTADLKARIENAIRADKAKVSDVDSIKADIQTTVQSIDTSKI